MPAAPEAVFDCLFIASELADSADGASEEDIYLFSYLSCLLFVYHGNPSAHWGYDFSSTPQMAPFSPDLSDALEDLEGLGWLGGRGVLKRLTEAGKSELRLLLALMRFGERGPYLSAACSTTLVLPLPAVVGGVLTEPGLRKALALSSTRPLLGEGGSQELYEHFSAIEQTVGLEQPDLMVPAVVWITYLVENVLDLEANDRNGEAAEGGD